MIKIFVAKDKAKIEREFNEWEKDNNGSTGFDPPHIISLHWALVDNSSEDDKPPYQSLLVHYE
jgi:hypothetical protein